MLENLAENVGDDVSYQHTFDTLSTDSHLVNAKEWHETYIKYFRPSSAVTWQKAPKSVLKLRKSLEEVGRSAL